MNGFLRGLSLGTATLIAVSAYGGDVSAQTGDGYLFGQPRVTLGIETGYGFQQASGPLYTDLITAYTLEERDFDAPYVGAELGVRLADQLDLTLGVGWEQSSTFSESRPYVDEDGLPINQMTELQRVPLTAGVTYFLTPRGRSLSRLAWVPRTITPFVTAGVGVLAWELNQYGDFVVDETLEIFTDELRTSGAAPLLQAGAGLNLSLGPRILFGLEGKYSWASADPTGDFAAYDQLDLHGVRVTGGLAVRF